MFVNSQAAPNASADLMSSLAIHGYTTTPTQEEERTNRCLSSIQLPCTSQRKLLVVGFWAILEACHHQRRYQDPRQTQILPRPTYLLHIHTYRMCQVAVSRRTAEVVGAVQEEARTVYIARSIASTCSRLPPLNLSGNIGLSLHYLNSAGRRIPTHI